MDLSVSGVASLNVKWIAKQDDAVLAPGDILYIEVPIPEGAVLLGGGGEAQWAPAGSAANCVIKSTKPYFRGSVDQGWSVVFTNCSAETHPQKLQFTAWASYVEP